MTYVAFDHYEGGKMSGEWAAEWLDGKGKVAIILGAPGQTSDQRKNGFLEIINEYPEIEVVRRPLYRLRAQQGLRRRRRTCSQPTRTST